MTTLHIRIDDKLKKEARKILENLGMDLTTAINMFLVQVQVTKSIPFAITAEPRILTPAQEKSLLKDLESARKSKRTYRTAEEATRDILRRR